MEEITLENHKKLNELLQRDSPEHLVKGLEHLIGMLRDASEADAIDVELWLKDHNKFKMKLEKIDPTTLTIKNVIKHREGLYALKEHFVDND